MINYRCKYTILFCGHNTAIQTKTTSTIDSKDIEASIPSNFSNSPSLHQFRYFHSTHKPNNHSPLPLTLPSTLAIHMPPKPPVPRETHAEIRCVTSLLPNATGSCEVSMNETMVMAAVHGPLAPRSDDREYSDEGKVRSKTHAPTHTPHPKPKT